LNKANHSGADLWFLIASAHRLAIDSAIAADSHCELHPLYEGAHTWQMQLIHLIP